MLYTFNEIKNKLKFESQKKDNGLEIYRKLEYRRDIK